MKPPPDKQTILDSLAAIARGAGRSVKAAGLRPNILNVHLEDGELLEDWALAVRRNRKIPARRAYRHQDQYDPRTFERRFGPWSKLPEALSR